MYGPAHREGLHIDGLVLGGGLKRILKCLSKYYLKKKMLLLLLLKTKKLPKTP